jgi:hypothetical protein
VVDLVTRLATLISSCGGNPEQYFSIANDRGAIECRDGEPEGPNFTVPLVTYGHVLNRWHTDPDFLDEQGAPLDLPIVGRMSLLSLLERLGIADSLATIRAGLLRFGFAIDRPDGTLRVQTRVSGGPKEFALYFGLMMARDALANAAKNVRADSSADRWFQRAVVNSIPSEYVDEFRLLVLDQSMTLLSNLDDWMEAKRRKAGSSGPTVACRVHVFLVVPGHEDNR